MAWFKVDDAFATSPKVLRIPRAQRLAAIGLWTVAGTWCAKHLTDGVVPGYMLEEWGAEVSHGTALVDAGLWRATDDGYAFHDWLDYQPSKVSVRETREKERQRKEAWRTKKSENAEQSPAVVPHLVPVGRDGVSQQVSGHPDPTRPDPSRPVKERGSAAKKGTRIAADFSITPAMREWAKTNVPLVDIDGVLAEFVDYWSTVPGQRGVSLDWTRTWYNGMRKQQGFAVRDGRTLSRDAYEPGQEYLTR